MTDVESFEQITKGMLELYKRKNADYGGSVTETYRVFGLTSFLVRMQDKLNRLVALEKNKTQQVNDEKIDDTLIDLANYAILAKIEIDREKVSQNSLQDPGI